MIAPKRVVSFVLVTLLATGCQSEVALGARCARSAECSAPLVCRAGRCRSECVANRDCPVGARCLLVERTGTCSLDDDVCTSATLCASGLVCVDGACVNACETLLQCPPDAACVTSTGVAHCEPRPVGDGGAGGDGGAQRVTVVAANAGLASSSGGMVQLPPPAGARAGDTVVLLIDRYAETSAILQTIGHGWAQLATTFVDFDSQEIGVCTASADETADPARYAFPAAGEVDWAMIVLRGASGVRSLRSTASPAPFTYGTGGASDGALLLDAVATDYPENCNAVPTSPGYLSSVLWHVLPISVSSGVTPSVTITCGSSVLNGAVFQLVADP